MLLAVLAGVNAVNAQAARYASLNPAPPAPATPTTADPLWWALRTDYFHGRTIERVDVAATGPAAPLPRGIPRLPGPGAVYASPPLSDLLASTPATHLADRSPAHRIGTIGPAGLPSPDSLVLIAGGTADQVSHLPRARPVTNVTTRMPGIPAA